MVWFGTQSGCERSVWEKPIPEIFGWIFRWTRLTFLLAPRPPCGSLLWMTLDSRFLRRPKRQVLRRPQNFPLLDSLGVCVISTFLGGLPGNDPLGRRTSDPEKKGSKRVCRVARSPPGQDSNGRLCERFSCEMCCTLIRPNTSCGPKCVRNGRLGKPPPSRYLPYGVSR